MNDLLKALQEAEDLLARVGSVLFEEEASFSLRLKASIVQVKIEELIKKIEDEIKKGKINDTKQDSNN